MRIEMTCFWLCFLVQIFLDLCIDVSYQDSNAPLHICEDEILGKGGFGFVCKGEIQVGHTTAGNVRRGGNGGKGVHGRGEGRDRVEWERKGKG